MSDFESRLSDALSSGAEGAPDASGLAEGARRRSRRRRTTIAVAAAAVVVAVAVPVGVVALNDGGSDTGRVAEDTPVAPSATRVETWHGVSVEVPATWGYGGRTSWCIGGDAESPVVQRPGVVRSIGCSPTFSWGVSFEPRTVYDPDFESGRVWYSKAADGADYPEGTWHGFWYDGDVVVQVAAQYKEEAQAIIDSAHRVDSVDDNGCPVEREEGFTTDSEQLSVCRYDGDGQLEQSERLSADDTAEATAALNAAPAGNAEMPASCDEDQAPYLVVDMISTDLNSSVIIQAPCPYKPGITSGGESFQELTSDVLYWALSPGWSGGLANGIPVPHPLRALSVVETDDPSEPVCDDMGAVNGPARMVNVPPDEKLPWVCRYELDWGAESGGSYVLESERQLDDDELDEFLTTLEQTPTVEQPVSQDCTRGRGEMFAVYWAEGMATVNNGECGSQSILTADGDQMVYRATSAELLDALGSPYGLLR